MRRNDTTTTAGRRLLARIELLAMLLLCSMTLTAAQASTVLLADTTLVAGTESAVYSFSAPGPGTVSVQLTNLDWPQALSSLSFMATTANQVLSSLSAPSSASTQSLTFPVAGGGTYFADVMAAAGGPLDLGIYSFSLNFTPAGSPVPLPASGALLLGGIGGIVGLIRWLRGTRSQSAVPTAPHPGR